MLLKWDSALLEVAYAQKFRIHVVEAGFCKEEAYAKKYIEENEQHRILVAHLNDAGYRYADVRLQRREDVKTLGQQDTLMDDVGDPCPTSNRRAIDFDAAAGPRQRCTWQI